MPKIDNNDSESRKNHKSVKLSDTEKGRLTGAAVALGIVLFAMFGPKKDHGAAVRNYKPSDTPIGSWGGKPGVNLQKAEEERWKSEHGGRRRNGRKD